MAKKVLFIDRDGTIIQEPEDEQIDRFDKYVFVHKVIRNLYQIATYLDYELVIVSNQDGLGTPSFPEKDFWPIQNHMMRTLNGEGVTFSNVIFDRTRPEDHCPTRKPGTALLTDYFSDEYNLKESYVIGDRLTDVALAKNLQCMAILLGEKTQYEDQVRSDFPDTCKLITSNWDDIFAFLRAGERKAIVERNTAETQIHVELDLDGSGKGDIQTGLGFFDHMLDQIARHSGCDLKIHVKGDLNVDEHHTIEDTGIALGEALLQALGNKRGIARYGFVLPMDDCLAQVALDFGGRSWLVWDVPFQREYIGDVPTEMFYHFFKSLTDAARMNLNVKAEGDNEHHKIEGVFKAFARSIRAAIHQDVLKYDLPSTKGAL